MHEISIEHDLDWVDCADQEEAHEFRAELGHDKCDIRVNEEGQWKVRLKRGAVLAIPKALQFDRTVAGQIPTGWDPVTLGIPADIVEQVDPVTLFTLVATAEALMCAGLPNAYEMYKYVHVTEVGNTSGGLPSHAFVETNLPPTNGRKKHSRRHFARILHQHHACMGEYVVALVQWPH